ncbi:MAG: hypothetical protein AAF307_03270 [Pseudomonadota bacterium]
MILKSLYSRLANFARREDGTLALEAMIVLPAMFWAFLAIFSIFETVRTYDLAQKAAFTIGDAISRETAPLDNNYMIGMHALYEYLSQTQGQSAIRVSSLRWDAGNNRFYSDWSRTQGNAAQLTSEDVRSWSTRLPVMPDNERVMLVETWSNYDPPFDTGLGQREIRNFVFTRPRFAPRVCWEQCQ